MGDAPTVELDIAQKDVVWTPASDVGVSLHWYVDDNCRIT